MKSFTSLPFAVAFTGLFFAIATHAQLPLSTGENELRRIESELGLDKVPAPQPRTRGFLTRDSEGDAPAALPRLVPSVKRSGFRVRGVSVRGGELDDGSSPVVLPTPSSAAAPPPPITVSKQQAQNTKVEAVEIAAVQDSETQLDVQFEFNSTAYLDPRRAEVQLSRLAAVMVHRPDIRILVEGHCCDLGDEHHNNVLSFYRAEALADHLASLIVALDPRKRSSHAQARSRVQTIGFGETDPLQPISSGDSASLTEAKRLANRRVRCRLAMPEA